MNRQQAKTQIKALRLDPEISNRFNCDLRQTTEQLITLINEINEFNSQRFNQRANEAQTEETPEESPEEAVSRLAREIIEADESWGMTTETQEETQEETTRNTSPQPYIKPSIWYGITEGATEGDRLGGRFINPSAPGVTTA